MMSPLIQTSPAAATIDDDHLDGGHQEPDGVLQREPAHEHRLRHAEEVHLLVRPATVLALGRQIFFGRPRIFFIFISVSRSKFLICTFGLVVRRVSGDRSHNAK